ncbi:MAG: serine protease [Candidatus Niyogibacteria bacterium]|nr:serine protease [Candidatus Niyogibacteria bacterium]
MKRWGLTLLALVAAAFSVEAGIDNHMVKFYQPLPYLVEVYSSQQSGTGSQNFGRGSGFFYQNPERGCFIFTNSHVVGPVLQQKMWVRFESEKDGRQVGILGNDPVMDVALLECPSPLPPDAASASLGNESDIVVGQMVYGVGWPFGVRSVAKGEINAPESPFSPFMFANQSPVHPGNSGGPLFTVRDSGEVVVVGMNTLQTPQGLQSHSLAVQYIERLAIQMLSQRGVVYHGTMGMKIESINGIHPDLYQFIANRTYPPNEKSGVLVTKVFDGSPAARVGIKAGDIIVEMSHDGQPIPFATMKEFFVELALTLKPNDSVHLSARRGDQSLEFDVRLEPYIPQD